MTALRPTESHAAIGVAAVRYEPNKTCAHPECDKPTESHHHIFPRSQIGNGSWFVALGDFVPVDKDGRTYITKDAIPHVVGLCGSGTTGHHGDLEEHRAWIKLEDGWFNWYDRRAPTKEEKKDYEDQTGGHGDDIPVDFWVLVGALHPQPGSRDGKTKRKKKASTPQERQARETYCIKKPKGEENLLPEVVAATQETFQRVMGADDLPLPYVTVLAACHEFNENHS